MSIVYILAQSVGYALCQTRLVIRKEYETTKGDYSFLLTGMVIVSVVVGELAGVLYIVLKGQIFKPEPRSENTGKLANAVLILCFSS